MLKFFIISFLPSIIGVISTLFFYGLYQYEYHGIIYVSFMPAISNFLSTDFGIILGLLLIFAVISYCIWAGLATFGNLKVIVSEEPANEVINFDIRETYGGRYEIRTSTSHEHSWGQLLGMFWNKFLLPLLAGAIVIIFGWLIFILYLIMRFIKRIFRSVRKKIRKIKYKK